MQNRFMRNKRKKPPKGWVTLLLRFTPSRLLLNSDFQPSLFRNQVNHSDRRDARFLLGTDPMSASSLSHEHRASNSPQPNKPVFSSGVTYGQFYTKTAKLEKECICLIQRKIAILKIATLANHSFKIDI